VLPCHVLDLSCILRDCARWYARVATEEPEPEPEPEPKPFLVGLASWLVKLLTIAMAIFLSFEVLSKKASSVSSETMSPPLLIEVSMSSSIVVIEEEAL